jgi:hypothetical protein
MTCFHGLGSRLEICGWGGASAKEKRINADKYNSILFSSHAGKWERGVVDDSECAADFIQPGCELFVYLRRLRAVYEWRRNETHVKCGMSEERQLICIQNERSRRRLGSSEWTAWHGIFGVQGKAEDFDESYHGVLSEKRKCKKQFNE